MKVFIAGPRAVKTLNKGVKGALSRMIEKQRIILLGDANGVDRLVQEYFAEARYPHVHVYASDGKARNNIGNWPVHSVAVPAKARGFDFYVQKDIQMAQDADNGFMVWNGKSKGTLNNIINLLVQNKKAIVYLTPAQKTFCLDTLADMGEMAERLGQDTFSLYHELLPKAAAEIKSGFEQLSLSSQDH